jgi:hypothetical protein
MPLFENASSSAPVEVEALVNITPGFFNNLFVNDVVFVGFEENALEKPIILGKLYKGGSYENATLGGAGVLDTLKVRTSATIPAATTLFEFPEEAANEYKDLKTPKKMADYIKWLEKLTKNFVSALDINFRCFKNWLLWYLRPENVKIDDGDLEANDYADKYIDPKQHKETNCTICGAECTKNKKRQYAIIDTTKRYPKL